MGRFSNSLRMNETPCNLSDCLNLKQRELELVQKEIGLAKQQKKLQREIEYYQRKNDEKAQKDIRAALKLKTARKKLLQTVGACEKCKSKHGKKTKYTTWFDLIHSTIENSASLFDPHKRRKVNSMCECYIKRILGTGCPYTCGKAMGKAKLRQRPNREYDCEALAGLGRTPPLWGFHSYPLFYPKYHLQDLWRNLWYCTLFLAGLVFWTPCILCLLLLKCCCCSCCSDC